MGAAVVDSVSGPIVTGCAEHRDADGRGGLECLVHRRHPLLAPTGLRCAPADRDDRGAVDPIKDRGRDSIDETTLRVGREVDRDAGSIGDRSSDFDVQQDFSIIAVRIAVWSIRGSVHRYCEYRRYGKTEP